MIETKDFKEIETNKHVITDSSFKLLHYDDMPILYCGQNADNEYVIGSTVDENYDWQLSQYFAVIVDKEIYDNFLEKIITYKESLQKARTIYLVDAPFEKQFKSSIYSILYKDIPEDHLPSDDSYCPESP